MPSNGILKRKILSTEKRPSTFIVRVCRRNRFQISTCVILFDKMIFFFGGGGEERFLKNTHSSRDPIIYLQIFKS